MVSNRSILIGWRPVTGASIIGLQLCPRWRAGRLTLPAVVVPCLTSWGSDSGPTLTSGLTRNLSPSASKAGIAGRGPLGELLVILLVVLVCLTSGCHWAHLILFRRVAGPSFAWTSGSCVTADNGPKTVQVPSRVTLSVKLLFATSNPQQSRSRKIVGDSDNVRDSYLHLWFLRFLPLW